MKNFRTRVRYIFLEVDSVYLPLISALGFLVWAIVLANPIETFSTSISYEVMEELALEGKWAWAFLLTSIAQIWATFACRPWFRQAIVNFFAMFMWLFLTTMIVLGNPVSTGWIYLVFALLCLGRFYRCFQDKDDL